MRKYKIAYEDNGKYDYAVVEAKDLVNARKTFLLDYADIDPEIDGISPYTIYDEIQFEKEGYSTEYDEKKDTRSNLIRLAALLVAEIERIDRRQ